MENRLKNKRYWLSFSLGLVLLGCMTLQAPIMAYSMSSMDCEAEMVCGACVCVADTLFIPLPISYSNFIGVESPEALELIFYQKPPIQPPR